MILEAIVLVTITTLAILWIKERRRVKFLETQIALLRMSRKEDINSNATGNSKSKL